MKKSEITKEILMKNGITIEFDENNQPIIYQYRENHRKHYNYKRPIHTATREHKYGHDISYQLVGLKINNEYRAYTVQSIVYIYFKGSIPEGYDVDHIDDNPLNNHIDNLQLLTRKDNLNKRGIGANQYTKNIPAEERIAIRDANRALKERADRLRPYKEKYKARQKALKLQYEETKVELAEVRQLMIAGKTKELKQRERELIDKKLSIGRELRVPFKDYCS